MFEATGIPPATWTATRPRDGYGVGTWRSARASRWLDTWAGIGLIAVELHRQGWGLQLTQYGDGNWRATFYVTGAADSIVGGSAWEQAPWSQGALRGARDASGSM